MSGHEVPLGLGVTHWGPERITRDGTGTWVGPNRVSPEYVGPDRITRDRTGIWVGPNRVTPDGGWVGPHRVWSR